MTCPYRKCDGSGDIPNAETNSYQDCDCRLAQLPRRCREKARFPAQYMSVSLDDFKTRAMPRAKLEALDGLVEYAQNWAECRARGIGLALLSRSVSTGKSAMAVALARAIVGQVQTSIEQDLVLFVNVGNLAQQYRDFWSRWPVSMPEDQKYADQDWSRSKDELFGLWDRMSAVEFLVLDDLGEMDRSESFVKKLRAMIESRITSLKPMVVTSNDHWDDLVRKFDDGINNFRFTVDRLITHTAGHAYVLDEAGHRPKKTRSKKLAVKDIIR